MSNTKTLLQAALDAAQRGWHVFPLRPGDKRPAFPDHLADRCTGREHRCQQAGTHVGWEPRATRDPDRIRRAWSRTPYNIGIACGPSGLAVVDLDTPKQDTGAPPPPWNVPGVNNGADAFALLCDQAGHPMPLDTYTVTTGRAGTHLYYRHPDTGPDLRNTTSGTPGALGWLIDTRAHGGYVVAAGSTVAGRPYTTAWNAEPAPLPGWLAERLTPRPLPPQQPVTVDLAPDRSGAYLRAAIDQQLAQITTAPAGGRNRALYLSAVALGQLVAGGAIAEQDVTGLLTQAAQSAGLRPAEITRTVHSGLRAGAARPRSVAA